MGILDLLKRGTRWDSLAGLPPIDTDRLRLSPLREDDAAALRTITDDPAVSGAIDFLPDRFGIDDARALIRASRGGRDVFLGASERETGSLVGVVGTHLRSLEAIEIGYWIGGAARGRGYGSEAVGAVVGALARRFARRVIVAECRPDNVASWGMLHKLGFRPTGDAGNRPGRKILVWDVRDAPTPQAGSASTPQTGAGLRTR